MFYFIVVQTILSNPCLSISAWVNKRCTYSLSLSAPECSITELNIHSPQACYGRHDSESVQRVKALYDALQMPMLYRTYEDESYQRLQKLIATHAQNLPHSVFLNFANKIYKRNKWARMGANSVGGFSLFPLLTSQGQRLGKQCRQEMAPLLGNVFGRLHTGIFIDPSSD